MAKTSFEMHMEVGSAVTFLLPFCRSQVYDKRRPSRPFSSDQMEP